MKKIKHFVGKPSLLLITAILILCAGFLVVGCGTDPQLKGKLADKGAYAVDFSQCPGTYCYGSADADPDSTGTVSIPDISASEITMEAWIKRSGSSTVTGGVFSRLSNDGGAVLFVKENEPKFAIRRQINATSGTGENAAIDYVVESNVALSKATWTHIAGVVANSAHTHTSTSDCTATVMAETPHLDIYINGEFKNCAKTYGDKWVTTTTKDDTATTEAQFADNPVTEKVAIGNIGDGIFKVRSSGTTTAPVLEVEYSNNLDAVIDEVRFWLTGKTAEQISACMYHELGYSGTCSRADTNLTAYYRLNEGTGKDLVDWSGSGLAGGLAYRDSAGDEHEWEDAHEDGAWVSGMPSISSAD